MKTSTEIGSVANLVGEKKSVELIARAGFDAWDLSMFNMCFYDQACNRLGNPDHPFFNPGYLKYIRELRNIGESEGICCNQSHAPFPTDNPMIRDYIKRSIECSAEAGAGICVIHPGNNLSPEENAEFYNSILPFAKSCGVKIATENMWNWDETKNQSCFAACATSESFLDHIRAVNDEAFVACLDIGHAEMAGSGSGAANMIRALGPSLQALHIHDNNLHDDNHALPFTMGIDFEAVVAALREIGYQGDVTMEACGYIATHTPDTLMAALCTMRKVAQRIRNMIQFCDESI